MEKRIYINYVENIREAQTYTDYTSNVYAVSRLHVHTGHELVICYTPSAIVFSGNSVVRASGYMAIFYPSGEAHLQLNQPNSPYKRFLVEYPADFLNGILPVSQNPQQFFCLPLQPEAMQTLQPYMDLLLKTVQEPEDMWKENRQKYLIALLQNELSGYMRENSWAPSVGVQGKEQQIYSICIYIQRNYREKFSLESLAERHFISRATLSRQFRNVLGMSVNDYIRRVRISYAVQYLKQGYSVQETADLCGFSDAGYFIKVFEQICGTTPANYRKKMQK